MGWVNLRVGLGRVGRNFQLFSGLSWVVVPLGRLLSTELNPLNLFAGATRWPTVTKAVVPW